MKVLKMISLGLAVIIMNQLVMLLISLPFGVDTEDVSSILFLVFALMAPVMTAITYLFAMLMKPESMAKACRSGGIWSMFLIVFYILIGLGNNNIATTFQTPTLYLMFLCTFAGPIVFAKAKAAREQKIQIKK